MLHRPIQQAILPLLQLLKTDISSAYCTIAILLDPRFKLDFYVDDTKTSTEISNQQNEAWIQLRRVLDAYYPVSESTSAPEPCSFSGVNRIFKKLKTAVADDEIRSYLKEYPRCGPDVNPMNSIHRSVNFLKTSL